MMNTDILSSLLPRVRRALGRTPMRRVLARGAWIIRHPLGERHETPKAGPNRTTLDFLATTRCRAIAEIGVDLGTTSEGIARWLDNDGVLHLFDFEPKVRSVAATLRRAGFSNIVPHGNSMLELDSYNWSLMKMLRDGPLPAFDYVYLDGSHAWAIDGLAFCLIDRLLSPGGYVDFDDYDWTIDSSPTVNPRIYPANRRRYTQEQMRTPQVKLIVDLLVRREGRYEEIVPNKIFRKQE